MQTKSRLWSISIDNRQPSDIGLRTAKKMSILLQLPLELRLQILETVIGCTAIPFTKLLEGSKLAHDNPHPNPDITIALANSQLYHEAMSVVYSKVTFTFFTSTQLRLFFAEDHLNTRCSIQAIHLHLSMGQLLNFLRARSGDHFRPSTIGFFWRKTFLLVMERLTLRRICIHIPNVEEGGWEPRFGQTTREGLDNLIWQAGYPLLMNVPEVDFQGSISDARRDEWLQTLREWRLCTTNITPNGTMIPQQSS